MTSGASDGSKRTGLRAFGPAFCLIGLSYWSLAHLGLHWAAISGAGSPVWPAAGLGLTALVLTGVRMWPAIFLARLLAAWTIGSEQPLWADIALAASNAGAAAAGAMLLRRVPGFDAQLSTLPDTLWLLAASALLAVTAALPGTAVLAFAAGLDATQVPAVFSNFAFGNFAGALTVAPLILAWSRLRPSDYDRGSVMHLIACLGVVAALSAVIFTTDGRVPLRTWHAFPALVWAAVAFHVRGAAAALAIVSALAIFGSESGVGPFVDLANAQPDRAGFVQQFIGLSGSTILLLAGAADERRLKDALATEVAERRAAEARVRAIVDTAIDAIVVIDRKGTIQSVNPAAERIFAYPANEMVGGNVRQLMPDEHSRAHDGYMSAYTETGTAKIIGTGREVFGLRKDGSTFPLDLSITEWQDARGERYFTGIMRDVTERRAAEQREQLLAREVDHRAKNLLAVAQSVVHLSRAGDMPTLKTSISGRIQSLGRAHSLLAASRWEGADLKQLVCEEVTPFTGKDSPRAEIAGPNVLLRPAAAQALALVFHELATNAVKYGALSTPEGRLAIAWAQGGGADGASELRFRWQEIGGPAILPPTRRGFGSTVLRASVESQLKGTVALDWRRDGLVCDLSVPASEMVLDDGAGVQAATPGVIAPSAAPQVEGRRILVVEDEALIAIQIEETLKDAGCRVVGPAGRVDEALRLLAEAEVEAALLDVNVAGEMSYPVADALMTRGVPFAFATGYAGLRVLPERFGDRPVVAKPFAASELVTVVDQLVSPPEPTAAHA